ncbi:hypothetical protein M8C21_010027, partial [Ambrosia artemisiifolia]
MSLLMDPNLGVSAPVKESTKLLADNTQKAMKEQKHEHLPIIVGRTGTEMLTNEVAEVTRHVYAMSFVQVQALRGAHVVMGVRNVVAGKQVQEEIVNEIPTTKVDAMELDLSSMESVTKFASDFNSSGRSLNLL